MSCAVETGKLEKLTVETTSFASPTLDSPPLISIYYLPYEKGEVQKLVSIRGHHNSFTWGLYEKDPTLGL